MSWIIDTHYRPDRTLIITPFFEGLRNIADKLRVTYKQLDYILYEMGFDQDSPFWDMGKEDKLEKIMDFIKSKSQ